VANLLNTDKPVFCVMNYLEAVKDDKFLLISKLDWIRIGNFLRGHWPKKTPQVFLLKSGERMAEYNPDS
jgi:hypothetical protein